MNYILKDRHVTGGIETQVQGAHRHKYFKRPIIPVLNTVPPEIVMQIPMERIESAKEPVPEPKSKTVEVQTVFRESGAQTDPYSPNYEPDYQHVPEVLQIANLKFGEGLPATMAEMHLIE